MATALSTFAQLDEEYVRTIAFGQTVRLEWGTWLPKAGSEGGSFSGTLTLHAAGSSMNARFGLDTSDGRIALNHNATGFYVETLVHIDDILIGSYVDLGLGSYLKVTLREADREHIGVLLQRIEFTAVKNPLSSDGAGPQIITADLQGQNSSKKENAQIIINVVASSPSCVSPGLRTRERLNADQASVLQWFQPGLY